MPNNRRTFLAARLIAFVCIATFSLIPFASRAQTSSDKAVQMAIVQMALKDAGQGSYNGIMEKALGRIGDATAVASINETTAYVKSQRATYLQKHPNE